ncbi:hypothetical protein [Allostreptomyces psammosilenae]|uniref:SCP domain-containing protein n=1 Tax=Allostreptomyces psammosilenae TaxID=1892865 RepID=A0A852ZY64_9ACTN|nr:hypothetical protein [Allostreptomyces psammosilenae]NYI07276.1 hypothetical protein [Allostreptomyces psammosilenae]
MAVVVVGSLFLGAGTASAASCPESRRYATAVEANFHLFDTGGYTRPQADGLVDMEDMRRVAYEGSALSQVREAARYFYENPAEFRHMDGIRDGWRTDGLVTRDDVNAAIDYWTNECGESGNCPTSRHNATVVRNNFHAFDTGGYTRPQADGLVDMEDMRRIAYGGAAPYELREAGRYFYEHPAEFRHMDGIRDGWRTDGLVIRDDVDAALQYWANECG